MSQDMYDMNIPNITIPHIDGLEETLAVSNRISQSVNVAGMSAALATVSSVAASIPTGALEGARTVCNMASSMLDNSIVEPTTSAVEACTTIYDSPALQAASEITEIVSDSLPTKFLEESLEVSNAVIESNVSPITHVANSIVELFAGVGGLVQVINDSIASRMQELYENMREFIRAVAERFKQFIENFVSYFTETKILPAAITYDPVCSISCTGPPGKISKFCTYSYKIRKTYLRLSRERGSSDDANYSLSLSNNVNFASC